MGAEGSKLQEKYHIQKVKLGEGSFGIVWRAMDRSCGRVVAIKCCDKERMRKRGVQPADMQREISDLKTIFFCFR
jgi:serine/threonine protein kinase